MSETLHETRTVDVLDASGSKAGTAELPGNLFDVTANVPLIHQVVVAQLAAARQGTHATKTRGDVRGGGKKPYRQKGTGRARQGSIRSPQYAGGGVAHGPQPRNYAQRTPKKMIVAALRGALSDRARDGRVHVLADLVIGDSPSTKAALAALAAIGSSTKKLVVLHRDDDLAWLSLRNVAEVHALEVGQLNAYDVLCNDDIVFTTAALEAYVSGPAKGKSAKAVAAESEVEIETDEPTNAELEAATGESKFGAGSYVGEEPPNGFDIKGNEDSMKFHTPDSPWYARTVAEVWFDSAEAAEAAGFVDAVTADETEEDDK